MHSNNNRYPAGACGEVRGKCILSNTYLVIRQLNL